MVGQNPADAPDRARSTMDSVRITGPSRLHPAHQVAVGDSGGHEEGVVALHQFIGLIDVVELEAGIQPLLLLVVGAPVPAASG